MQTDPLHSRQRALHTRTARWLNGFLAGLYSAAAARLRATSHASLKIAVLYASQSGTAEGLARKVAKELKAKGHVASLISLEGYTPAALSAERYAILIASTYGEGEAPDAVQPFYEQLCLEHFPLLRRPLLSPSWRSAIPTTSTSANSASISTTSSPHSVASASVIASTAIVDLDEPFAQWKSSALRRLD